MKFLAGMIGAVFGGMLLAGLVAAADKGRVECYTEAELEQIEAVVASWLGHAAHADAGRIAEIVLAELVLVPQRRREACRTGIAP